ncbi:hypothetical protein [Sphingomonas sp. MA1305]|uniref:hypothetical protein n=1 Tax=Sphingomonas sp. MA1305 TaxID=2479204 RepID=UPI0018DF8E6D|nr:hypothetical protein [Sphingomonas sp. MA1305]
MRALVLIAILLTGCAPSLVGANEAGGVVGANFNMSRSKALALADAHCRKYGKVARISGQNEVRNSTTFDCVRVDH